MVPGPVKKDDIGRFFSFFESAITTLAFNARRGGAESAAGEAFHRLPPIVATFLICQEPIIPVASAKTVASFLIIG